LSPSITFTEQFRKSSCARYDLSVVIVSFNTREVLRRCLTALAREGKQLSLEVFVVDNGSRDGSVDMVASDFPDVHVLQAGRNLGFAAANNLAFPLAQGEYVVLLNSDAFLEPGALEQAFEHMRNEPDTGLGGGRLIGEDGSWQPSVRQFPSLLNDFLSFSGLAHRFRKSRFWGRADRTWADPLEQAGADWVPGAFSIIRASVLERMGGFDQAFFLYYEEVDLCRRIKAAGFAVRYWPDVVVIHLGGESSKSMRTAIRSKSGAQLTLWRMRSGFLYYRKHHGGAAWRLLAMESGWHLLRFMRNRISRGEARREKAEESRTMMSLARQAWKETRGGRYSPAKPW
jgi:GT2 family glycosyltransferase